MFKKNINIFLYFSIFFFVTVFSFAFTIFLIFFRQMKDVEVLLVFLSLTLISFFITLYFFNLLRSYIYLSKIKEESFDLIDEFNKVVIFVENNKISFVNKRGKKFFESFFGREYDSFKEFILNLSNEKRYNQLLKSMENLPEGKLYSIQWNLSTNKILQMDIKKRKDGDFVVIFDVKNIFDTIETTLKIYEEITRNILKKINGYCWSGVINEKEKVDYLFCVGNVKGVTGYGRREFLSRGDSLIFSEDVPIFKEGIKKLYFEDMVEGRYRIITKRGDVKWIYETIIPNRNEEGDISYLLGIAFDITKERLEKDKIESRKRFLEKVFENIKNLIIITDEYGKVVYINESAKEFFNVSDVKYEGRTIVYKGILKDVSFEKLKIEEIIKNRNYLDGVLKDSGVYVKNGEKLYLNLKIIGFKEESGNNLIMFLLDNITEEIKKKELLERVGKLESLGLFAGGIAHNFNNLLFSIKGSLSILNGCVADKKGKKVLSRLEDIIEEAEVMSNRLITFAKGGGCIKKEIKWKDFLDMLNRLKENVERDFNVNVDIHCNLTDTIVFNCDITQIYEAIYNVIVNSCEAIGDGENVLLECSFEELENKKYLKLTVEDMGGGIPDDILPRVFYPYFSTKSGHLGLGLSISHRILKNHGGRIFLNSSNGKTTAEIFIPIRGEVISKSDGDFEVKANEPINVLVMDDDRFVREVFKDMLEELNCKVDVARDGESALELYKFQFKKGKPYDLVFLDLTIENGMGGKDAIRELKKVDPNVRAVVSSGYSDEDVMINYKNYDFWNVLKKPFELEDLEKIIKRVREEKERG